MPGVALVVRHLLVLGSEAVEALRGLELVEVVPRLACVGGSGCTTFMRELGGA